MKKHLLLLLAFALCQMLATHDAFAQDTSKDDYLFYLTPSDLTVRETNMPTFSACTPIERQQLPLDENSSASHWQYNATGFLAMAKNEREGFNVFYREQGDAGNIKVTVDDFVNNNGEKLAHNLYYEEFFNPGYTADSLADALVPYNGKLIGTVPDHNRVFYVELRSAKDQTSGYYTSTVRLYKNNELLNSKTVTVKVWNFALPEQHYADAVMGLYNRNSGYGSTYYFLKHSGIDVADDGSIPDEQLEEAKAILDIYQEFLLDHGISTYEIPRWLIDDDPKAAELTMADPRRRKFTVPVNRWDFNDATLTTEGQNILNKYKYLVYDNAFLKDKAFFYPMDEPGLNDGNITVFNNITTVLSQEWPDYHATIPFCNDYDGSKSLFENKIDIFCPNQNFFNGGVWNENAAWANANLNDFKEHQYTWRYPGDNQCGGVFLDIGDLLSSGVMRRILFWQQYALGSEGILFWNCACYPDDIWSTKTLNKIDGLRNDNGDGILIYPSRTISQNEYTPIASLRLKQFADGIDDFDYLKLLEEFYGEDIAIEKLKEVLRNHDNYPSCLIINRHRECYHSYTCMDMFDTRYEIGELLNEVSTEHDWGDWEVAVEPDGTHEGLEIRTCRHCGTQESRVLPPYTLSFYLTPSDIQVTKTKMQDGDGPCQRICRQQLPSNEYDTYHELGWGNTDPHPTGFLAMAKNEREGFNIFYREQQKIRNIKIVVDDFVNSSGEELAHSLYIEEFFNYDSADSLADALVPYSGALQVTVVNQNKAFYVELRSTKDQTPGYYTSTIKLCEGDYVLDSKTVTVRVWNFALPEQHYADAVMGLYNRNSGYGATSSFLKWNGITVDGEGNIPEGQLQDAKQILQSYQEFLLDHGISTYEIPRWLIDDDPKAAELTMADPRRRKFTVPVNRNDFYGATLKPEGQNILNKYKDLVYDNAFLKDKSFFYPMDEPDWNNEITVFNNITTVLSQEWPGYHATIPFNSNYDQSKSLFENKVDIFCPNQDFFDPCGLSGETVAEANLEYFKNNEYTWRYPGDNMCGGVNLYVYPLLQPGVMRRVLFWQQYALNSKGILYWNCAYFPDDVWSTRNLEAYGERSTNGDGILIYPGLPIGQDKYTPIASLRLKQFADGIDDFDYLKLLEEFVGEDKVIEKLKNVFWHLDTAPLCYIINKEKECFVGWSCAFMFITRYKIGKLLHEANSTEHDWGDWEVAVEPDGTHEGLEIRTCQHCGTQESRVFSPYTFSGSGSWTDPSNWIAPDGSTPSTMPDLTNEYVRIDGIAHIPNGTDAVVKSLIIKDSKVLEINDGASLTITGTINNNNDVNSLIINDGGQIFPTNADVNATFRKNIVTPNDWEGTQKDGWQFISSPITNAPVEDFIPETGDYDLYVWSNTNMVGSNHLAPWVNYKAHIGQSDAFSTYFNGNFSQGIGYLASYQSLSAADFEGYLNNETSFNFSVSYNNTFTWNLFLLGNPFTFDIDWSCFSKTNVTNGFVTLNPETGAYTYQNSGTIKVGEGFVVQTTNDNPILSYTNNSKSERNSIKSINVTVSNSKGCDNTILTFDNSENGGFRKLENFNDEIASIYTVKDNVRYGINSYDADTQSIPLYFDAKEIGYYTISMQPTGDFDYIHLIDQQTGADIDMLLEGEYKFAAMSGDDKNRFIIKLSDDNDDDNDDCFAYQSGKTLYINEIGTIQIIDIIGRVVINETLSGNSVDISSLRNAAYIVRLVNENGVKTQKIVVL